MGQYSVHLVRPIVLVLCGGMLRSRLLVLVVVKPLHDEHPLQKIRHDQSPHGPLGLEQRPDPEAEQDQKHNLNYSHRDSPFGSLKSSEMMGVLCIPDSYRLREGVARIQNRKVQPIPILRRCYGNGIAVLTHGFPKWLVHEGSLLKRCTNGGQNWVLL